MNLEFDALVSIEVEKDVKDFVTATVFADVHDDRECSITFVSVPDPETGRATNILHKLDCQVQADLREKAKREYDDLLNAVHERESESNADIRSGS